MKFEFYREGINLGDWRWRLVSTNGKIVADGGEGYKRLGAMLATLRNIFKESPTRTRELQMALKLHEVKHGSLAKPFYFNPDHKEPCP